MTQNTLETDDYFDDLIVGSGISGMTMALLMGMAGRKVLLIEKQSSIGGCMRRFKCNGIPFDTGFHFTGGFGGLLSDMLRALAIDKEIEPDFLHNPVNNRLYFENSDSIYEMPSGLSAIEKFLNIHFPNEREAISRYLRKEEEIEKRTPSMNLHKLNTEELITLMPQIDEDFISLQTYFDSLTSDTKLQAILGAFAFCHGTPPKLTPLSSHCRVSVGMHKSLARIKGGGDAFIKAFKKQAEKLDITVLTNTFIASIDQREGKIVKSVNLSDNRKCYFKNCILSIHPADILSLLPEELAPTQIKESVAGYEESFSFFSMFATIKTENSIPSSLTSYLTKDDINSIISSESNDCAMAIVTATEQFDGKKVNTLCAFESEFPCEADKWKNSKNRKEDAGYRKYKELRAKSMLKKIERVYPEYAGKIEILATSSTLTFQDYIPPFGSAYGIMHKVGEQPLFGRLPVRNFYAIGQSSLLPGVVGAMLSSFIMARCLLGKNFLRL